MFSCSSLTFSWFLLIGYSKGSVTPERRTVSPKWSPNRIYMFPTTAVTPPPVSCSLRWWPPDADEALAAGLGLGITAGSSPATMGAVKGEVGRQGRSKTEQTNKHGNS